MGFHCTGSPGYWQNLNIPPSRQHHNEYSPDNHKPCDDNLLVSSVNTAFPPHSIFMEIGYTGVIRFTLHMVHICHQLTVNTGQSPKVNMPCEISLTENQRFITEVRQAIKFKVNIACLSIHYKIAPGNWQWCITRPEPGVTFIRVKSTATAIAIMTHTCISKLMYIILWAIRYP